MNHRRGAEGAENCLFCLSGDDYKQKHVSGLCARSDSNFVTFVLFVVTNCLTTKDAKYTKEKIQGRHYLCKAQGAKQNQWADCSKQYTAVKAGFKKSKAMGLISCCQLLPVPALRALRLGAKNLVEVVLLMI